MVHRAELVAPGGHDPRFRLRRPRRAGGGDSVQAVEQPLELAEPGGPLAVGRPGRSRLGPRPRRRAGEGRRAAPGSVSNDGSRLARPLHEPMNVPAIGLPAAPAQTGHDSDSSCRHSRATIEPSPGGSGSRSRQALRRHASRSTPAIALTRAAAISIREARSEPLGKQPERGAVGNLGGVQEVSETDAVVIGIEAGVTGIRQPVEQHVAPSLRAEGDSLAGWAGSGVAAASERLARAGQSVAHHRGHDVAFAVAQIVDETARVAVDTSPCRHAAAPAPRRC